MTRNFPPPGSGAPPPTIPTWIFITQSDGEKVSLSRAFEEFQGEKSWAENAPSPRGGGGGAVFCVPDLYVFVPRLVGKDLGEGKASSLRGCNFVV